MKIGQNLRLYSIAFVIASLLLSACKSSTSQPQTPSTAPPSSSSNPQSSNSPPSTPSTSGQSSSLPSPSSSSPSSSSPANSPNSSMPSTSGSTNSNSSANPGTSSGSSQPGVTVSSSGSRSSSGLPGSSMPSTGSSSGGTGNPGGSSFPNAGTAGQTGVTPGAESPGNSSVFDTAQPGQQRGDVDFSESSQPSGGQGSTQTGNAPYSPGATSRNEQVAVLDGELDGSMGEYDGMILRERKYVLARGNEAGSEEAVEDFDRSLEYYDEGDEAGGSPDAPENSSNDDSSDTGGVETDQGNGDGNGSARSRGGPGSGNDGPYPPPEGIPSGNDDDIVARQMREAALFEPDPQLRKDLWEAYRKYKEDTR